MCVFTIEASLALAHNMAKKSRPSKGGFISGIRLAIIDDMLGRLTSFVMSESLI